MCSTTNLSVRLCRARACIAAADATRDNTLEQPTLCGALLRELAQAASRAGRHLGTGSSIQAELQGIHDFGIARALAALGAALLLPFRQPQRSSVCGPGGRPGGGSADAR